MALDPNEKKSQSVRRGLILLLISLQIVTVVLILSITHFSTERDINDQISILLQNALNESKEHTQGFLESSYRSVLVSTDLLSKGTLDLNNIEQLEEYFLSQLKSNPEMTGAYLATPDGDFYFVTRDNQNEQSGFMTKVIKSDSPGKASFFWRYESSRVTESRLDQDDDYSAIERPWYRQAIAKESLVWTEPYIFFTSKKPGITVAAPFYDDNKVLLGVVGIDIELTQLSDFLAQLKIYGSISVFMVSGSGNFVAAPSISSDDMVLDTLNVQTTSEKNLTVEKKAVNHFLQNSSQEDTSSFFSRFSHSNENYVIRYEPFLLNEGPEWIIGAYAPKNTFLSKIRSGENRNALIALLILALSLLIGWVLIKRTWQPFERFFHDVITDQLTGLFNRRFLENVGSRMYIRLLRDQHEAISIAVIDLDYFKKINLEFGNATGNKVLIAFADFLKKTLRPEDIVTRYSGDMFVVIFPGMTNECAVNVVDRMRKQLDSWPLSVDDLLIRLTFSAGIETIDESNRIADAAFSDFIGVAKRAMRDAKASGRDVVVSANIKEYELEK
ncbi:MAG: sensor domain-containing diguanylate cyclase [Cellvibrionaceae bacterium]